MGKTICLPTLTGGGGITFNVLKVMNSVSNFKEDFDMLGPERKQT